MKRLNPKTGFPFKKGEIREDGYIFYQYRKILRETGYYAEYWLMPDKFLHHNYYDRSGADRMPGALATNLLQSAKTRSKGTPSRTASGRLPTNGKVTITQDWIIERLVNGFCEATGDRLTLAPKHPNTPSLDRIDPNNYDYTPENSRITTWQFNNMKGNFTDEEFIRVAEALKNVKQKSTSPVPAGHN